MRGFLRIHVGDIDSKMFCLMLFFGVFFNKRFVFGSLSTFKVSLGNYRCFEGGFSLKFPRGDIEVEWLYSDLLVFFFSMIACLTNL